MLELDHRTNASFRRQAVGKITFVVCIWAVLTATALAALVYDQPQWAKASLLAQIALVPGGLCTSILELRREWLGLPMDEWQNFSEAAPMLISFALAGVLYLLI